MFSTSLPPSPLPTDEEFNLFHSIDRQLYSKLTIDLGRDIAESMNVMALWLWLERQSTGGMTLVKRMLALPSSVINNLADESVVCLKCTEKEHFSYPESACELNLLPEMLGKNVPLKFFYDHRLTVLHGVTKLCSQVCARAFQDINQNALNVVTRRLSGQVGDVNRRAFSSGRIDQEGSSMVSQTFTFGGPVDQGASSLVNRRMSDHRRSSSFGGVDQEGSSIVVQAFSSGGFDQGGSSMVVRRTSEHRRASSFGGVDQEGSSMVGQAFPFGGGDEAGSSMVGRAFSFGGVHQAGPSMVSRAFSFGGVEQAGSSMVGRARPVLYTSEELGFYPAFEGQWMQQSPAVNDELSEIFSSNLNLEDDEISPEDRTIFLTFSKGYPISEAEVRDFFTRQFGDFIEEIYMQPVSPGEQVLYARVVARKASAIDAVVKGGKAKYNINGKHVCARKFVKRNLSSSSSAVSIAQSTSGTMPPASRRQFGF